MGLGPTDETVTATLPSACRRAAGESAQGLPHQCPLLRSGQPPAPPAPPTPAVPCPAFPFGGFGLASPPPRENHQVTPNVDLAGHFQPFWVVSQTYRGVRKQQRALCQGQSRRTWSAPTGSLCFVDLNGCLGRFGPKKVILGHKMPIVGRAPPYVAPLGKIFFFAPGTLVDPSLASPMRDVCYVWVSMGHSTVDGHAKQKRAHHWKSIGAFRCDTLGENVTGNSRVCSPNTYAHMHICHFGAFLAAFVPHGSVVMLPPPCIVPPPTPHPMLFTPGARHLADHQQEARHTRCACR